MAANPFKLTKADIERRNEISQRAVQAKTELDTGFEEYNRCLASAQEALEVLLTAYNEVVEEVNGFTEDIGRAHREVFDNRTNAWQDGERGRAANAWIEQYEESTIESLEVEWPTPLVVEDMGITDIEERLDELPDEVEAV